MVAAERPGPFAGGPATVDGIRCPRASAARRSGWVAAGYAWDGWDCVDWHERRKAGWDAVAAAFAASAR